MRCLLTTQNLELTIAISHVLSNTGIAHSIETATNLDWSQETYGDAKSTIWIENEEDIVLAKQILAKFLSNPQKIRQEFEKAHPHILHPEENTLSLSEKKASSSHFQLHEDEIGSRKLPRFQSHPITCSLVILLCAIYALIVVFPGATVSFSLQGNSPSIQTLSAHSPIEKICLFDYPEAWKTLDKVIESLSKESYNTNFSHNLTPFLPIFQKIENSSRIPYWKGIVSVIETHHSNSPQSDSWISRQAPMFEKIRQGQIWRSLSPALLHASFVHLIFNAMWVLLLLPALESISRKTSLMRLIFVLGVIALVSNISQYLMSGPNFVGFSGVVSGIAGYLASTHSQIEMNSIPAGFRVEKSTLRFLKAFIFGLAGVSCFILMLEFMWGIFIPLGIANTAHVTGWMTGSLLGQQNVLSTNRSI